MHHLLFLIQRVSCLFWFFFYMNAFNYADCLFHLGNDQTELLLGCLPWWIILIYFLIWHYLLIPRKTTCSWCVICFVFLLLFCVLGGSEDVFVYLHPSVKELNTPCFSPRLPRTEADDFHTSHVLWIHLSRLLVMSLIIRGVFPHGNGVWKACSLPPLCHSTGNHLLRFFLQWAQLWLPIASKNVALSTLNSILIPFPNDLVT